MRFQTADRHEIRRRSGRLVIDGWDGSQQHVYIRLGDPKNGKYRTRAVRPVDDRSDGAVRLEFLSGDTWRGCWRFPDQIWLYRSNAAVMALLLCCFMVSASTATADDDFKLQVGRTRTPAEVDRQLWDEYQDRRTERRVYALEQRRAINSRRPPARGWTAIVVPVNVWSAPPAIQRGLIRLPPIPRRRYYIDPFIPSYSR